jgi:hypothetical protein
MSSHIIKKKNSIATEDACVAPQYKPRYVLEETKAYHDEKKTLVGSIGSFCSWHCIWRLCCGTRWRAAIIISISLLSFLFNSLLMESMARAMNVGNYSLAKKQSFHFFDDIPSRKWHLLQKRVHKIRQKQGSQERRHHKRKNIDARKFYQQNYPAEFTCPHEERIGGMKGGGGKWVCSPKSIAIASADRMKNDGNGCLIYTSSADFSGFQFETGLLDILDCEIHVFQPNDLDLDLLHGDIPPNIHIHPWGFKASSSKGGDPKLKSVQETVMTLGHEGYTVDLLSLDCEGCEFDILEDVLVKGGSSLSNTFKFYTPPVFMQMLIQVHGVPPASHQFFKQIQNSGYVIFHKSPGNEGTGKEQDYGFLKLSQDFFIS